MSVWSAIKIKLCSALYSLIVFYNNMKIAILNRRIRKYNSIINKLKLNKKEGNNIEKNSDPV